LIEKPNKPLERTRHERASFVSSVGEQLKRTVRWLPKSEVVMRHTKWTVFPYVVYLSLFVWTASFAISSPLIAQLTQRVSHITNSVRDTAEALGYRFIAGNSIPDKWAEARQQGELVDYAYLTLFGPDSDNSHLGMNGRISVTVLELVICEE
jgi:hypothetical protein